MVDKAAEAKAKADKEAEEKAAAEAKAKADAKKPKKSPPFYLKPGKSLTTKKGIKATEKGTKKGYETEIKADWVPGGKETIEKFINSGHIGKA